MSVTVESQKLVTPGTVQLLEFDFTAIGGSTSVYVSTEQNQPVDPYIPIVTDWIDGSGTLISNVTFNRLDFELSGISCDLTGSIAEPTLKVAAESLWALSGWAAETVGFALKDYRGIRIRRMRQFYNTVGLMAHQVFYIKSVDELNPSTISFTLTPSLGSERLDRPSARKLEI